MTAGGFCALWRSYPLRQRCSRSMPSSFFKAFAISKQRAQRQAHSSSCVGLLGESRSSVKHLRLNRNPRMRAFITASALKKWLIVRLLTGRHSTRSSCKGNNTQFMDKIYTIGVPSSLSSGAGDAVHQVVAGNLRSRRTPTRCVSRRWHDEGVLAKLSFTCKSY
jgi:hypothetical protein